MTANLLAPLLIDFEKQQAAQMVLMSPITLHAISFPRKTP